MNRPFSLFWLSVLAGVVLLGGASSRPVAESNHNILLPVVAVPPGVLAVADEDGLRAAFERANTAAQFPRIELIADIQLTGALPPLDNPWAGELVIDGLDHTLNGNRVGTILSIRPDTTVLVENLTITGGSGTSGEYHDCGGAIYNEGFLTLRGSRIVDNWAPRGGGICAFSGGKLSRLLVDETTITGNLAYISGGGLYASTADLASPEDEDLWVVFWGSTIESNTAWNSGGGVYAFAGAARWLTISFFETALIGNHALYHSGGAIAATTDEGFMFTGLERSTIAGNTATDSAGFYNQGSSFLGGLAEADVRNSTFSGNVALDVGGAIHNVDVAKFPRAPIRTPRSWTGGAFLHMEYSTVTGNWATVGSGLANEDRLTLLGVIVAGNETLVPGGNCREPVMSLGYNLDDDSSCGLDQPTDLPAGQADLLPLALNAPGKTPTHALGPASQARDHIPPGVSGCRPGAGDNDQRGVSRPQPAGGRCDVGAYEANDE